MSASAQGWRWITQKESPNGLIIIQQSQPKYIDQVSAASGQPACQGCHLIAVGGQQAVSSFGLPSVCNCKTLAVQLSLTQPGHLTLCRSVYQPGGNFQTACSCKATAAHIP